MLLRQEVASKELYESLDKTPRKEVVGITFNDIEARSFMDAVTRLYKHFAILGN